MAKEESEKRGPIEKGEKGWPVNPFGVAAALVFVFIIIFLIVRPLLTQKTTIIQQDQQQNAAGGRIINPQSGEILKSSQVAIELSVDKPADVQKVEFWAKIYAENKWEKIGEVTNSPYEFEWQIPANFQNKAIALTSHIYQKNGEIIKDPGGWQEGIILLSE